LTRLFTSSPTTPAEDQPTAKAGPPGVEQLVPAGTVFPRRALVISVNDYLYLNPVNYGTPRPDSRNVHTLTNRLSGWLRIPREQVVQLSDAALSGANRVPFKGVITNTVRSFLATSRAQDRILLLFVGHAVENGDETYLVPIDGHPADKESLIPLDWLYKQLSDCPARQKVLIVDVCRLDPTRGAERGDREPMGEKLDAKLKAPPPGVQVWSACVAGQNSYEFANDPFGNGLFLEKLYEVLEKGLEGKIQRPADPLPLAELVEAVNQRMKATLEPMKKTQTSRLAGQEAEGGAAYDPNAAAPPRPAVAPPPPPEGGVARPDQVKDILTEIEVQPVRSAKDQRPLKFESLPAFDAKVLEAYKADGEKDAFREAVEKARGFLNDQIKRKVLREEFTAPGNENAFKDEIRNLLSRDMAVMIQEVETALEELNTLKEERGKQPKRWQANYDYILSRLEARLAFLYEYSTLLGQLRQSLPPREPGHDGWRMVALPKVQGDKAGRDAAKRSRALLDRLMEEHRGTPWEVFAKRDSLANMGLEWQSAKVGGQ
jgi:hypothetical protein